MSLRDWMGLRATEFATLDPMATMAVLPLAAVEQIGRASCRERVLQVV